MPRPTLQQAGTGIPRPSNEQDAVTTVREPPSDIGYKDQALTLEELQRGERCHPNSPINVATAPEGMRNNNGDIENGSAMLSSPDAVDSKSVYGDSITIDSSTPIVTARVVVSEYDNGDSILDEIKLLREQNQHLERKTKELEHLEQQRISIEQARSGNGIGVYTNEEEVQTRRKKTKFWTYFMLIALICLVVVAGSVTAAVVVAVKNNNSADKTPRETPPSTPQDYTEEPITTSTPPSNDANSIMEDVTPPELISLSVSPDSIDTASGPAQVHIQIKARDYQSGFCLSSSPLCRTGNGSIDIRHAGGGSSLVVGLGSLVIADGSEVGPIFDFDLTFPRYSPSGSYAITLSLIDSAYNSAHFDSFALVDRGFTGTVVVSNQQQQTSTIPTTGAAGGQETSTIPTTGGTGGDVLPPTLLSFTVSPTAVDTTFGPVQVRVEISARDDLAGFCHDDCGTGNGSIDVHHVSGDNPVGWGSLPIVSGTTLEPVFEFDLTFPRYSRAGDYPISITLLDVVYNAARYDAIDLAAGGFPSKITVTSTIQDVTPPELDSFEVSPTTVDTSDGPARVTVTMLAHDDLAGFCDSCGTGNGSIDVRHVSGANPVGSGSITIATGSPLAAMFIVILDFPQYSRSGDYPITVNLLDAVYNEVWYDSIDLEGLGFISKIVVL
uniref:Uncharacterized protein n=1 Tax=Amphora coffeiformis TaxID=265554 RepID=A0A7S3PAT4_9STRA|eukprot:scaffold34685_cov183-Amphora_coffeaeformis.AAC.33